MIIGGIPAFNEESSIAKVIVLARKHLDKVVVCDDGSSDITGELSLAMGAELIQHKRNLGYGASISSLFRKARADGADILVTIDGDGQHDPEQIPRLIEPILKGDADVVIGSRFVKGTTEVTPRYRKIGIRAITLLSNEMGEKITDSQSGFRAYGKRAIMALRPTEMGMGASTELLSRAVDENLKIVEVPATISYHGKTSTLNPVYHGLDVVLATVKHLSIRHPLMFYGIPGTLSLAVSLGFWWWTLSVYVEQHKVITNVALSAVASTVFGLILCAVGVILWVIISVVREGTGREEAHQVPAAVTLDQREPAP
jgi:glycosyltransferase involved in cell wall biosynthesis